MKKLALALALVLCLVVSSAMAVDAKIAVVTMDSMDVHWVRLYAAAEAKVAELNAAGNNITIANYAPEIKDNAQQIEKIQAASADGAEYIIISPNDGTSCNAALAEAKSFGAKVIYVDCAATEPGIATFATDNYAGGKQAGEYLLRVLTEKGITEGTIGICDAQPGAVACQNRYDGFASAFEGTAFVMGERQYSDGDYAKAQTIGEALITDGVVAIYGTNDGATGGAAAAVAEAAKNGTTIYMVGWDKSDSNIAHVEGGELLAFMAQNPNIMGEMAVEACVADKNGETLSADPVDTGVSTVDASNVADFK